jgi:mRNA-degrading endonuclease toxin of MazEF toxin-antitoxin module
MSAKRGSSRRCGRLDDEEMRQVTDRLLTSLELDISHRLGEAANP